MAIYYGDGSNSGSGRIIQKAVNYGNNTFSNSSAGTFQASVVNASITPKATDSSIICEVCCHQWAQTSAYHKQQLRISGGITDNDVGTWADVYCYSAISYSGYWLWKKDTIGTTSACTFTVWVDRSYFPNNSNTGSRSWQMMLTEVAN